MDPKDYREASFVRWADAPSLWRLDFVKSTVFATLCACHAAVDTLSQVTWGVNN
jgi:hypothetical protein